MFMATLNTTRQMKTNGWDFRFYQTHKGKNFVPVLNGSFQEEKFGDFKPCVFAMEEGWASSFLMSVETQHTIG